MKKCEIIIFCPNILRDFLTFRLGLTDHSASVSPEYLSFDNANPATTHTLCQTCVNRSFRTPNPYPNARYKLPRQDPFRESLKPVPLAIAPYSKSLTKKDQLRRFSLTKKDQNRRKSLRKKDQIRWFPLTKKDQHRRYLVTKNDRNIIIARSDAGESRATVECGSDVSRIKAARSW